MFKHVISYDNLSEAYVEVLQCVAGCNVDAVSVGSNAEEDLINLHNHLLWGSWHPESSENESIESLVIQQAFSRVSAFYPGSIVLCPKAAMLWLLMMEHYGFFDWRKSPLGGGSLWQKP